MKSPEMNSPVPSMKKQRSASPSQAMPMSAFSATTRSTMSRRFSSMSGLASWFGKAPVDLEAEARRPAGQPVEQPRRDEAAHAAAGVEHDVERADDGRVDERHDVLDVRLEHVLWLTAPRRGAAAAAGGRRQSCRGCPRSLPRRSAGTPPAGPSSCRCTASGLCDAVTCTPPSCSSARHGEVQHVGRDHPVVDDVGALRRGAVDERGRERRRGEAHVAADGDPLSPSGRRRTRAPIARATVFVDLAGIEPADVVGLEDAGLMARLMAIVPTSGCNR